VVKNYFSLYSKQCQCRDGKKLIEPLPIKDEIMFHRSRQSPKNSVKSVIMTQLTVPVVTVWNLCSAREYAPSLVKCIFPAYLSGERRRAFQQRAFAEARGRIGSVGYCAGRRVPSGNAPVSRTFFRISSCVTKKIVN
jgi:hypothetical protein